MNIIRNLFRQKEILLLILICSVFLILALYKLESVPPGINGDEASIGYNAILISETLRDENKRLLPLFVLTLNGKDWKQPVTVYSSVFFFKLFGASLFTLRFVSVFFVLVSLLLTYLILNEIFGKKYSLIGLIFFLSSPLIFIQSHLALENVAPLPFVCVWLLMLIKYFKNRKNLYLTFAGIFLGLSMYSYFGMRLVVSVYVLLTIFFLIFLKSISTKQKIESIKYFLFGLAPFILLILFANLKYPGAFIGNNSPGLPSSYQSFFLPFISSFDLSFLFIRGDATSYHSTGIHGMFLLFILPFFLFGIYQILNAGNFILKFILLSFFLTPLFFGFTDQIYRASRLMVLIPLFVIICTQGAIFLFKKTKIVFYILILLVVLSFTDFLLYYWNEYPTSVKNDFSSTSNITFKKLSELSKKYNLKSAVLWDYYLKEDIAAKFFEQSYFDKPLIMWRPDKDLSQDTILLTSSADKEMLRQKGFKEMKLSTEEYSLFLPDRINIR